jgi:hypothetical protein
VRFKSGDKVWALSAAANEACPPGKYAGTIVAFHEHFTGPVGQLWEVYVVDIPEVDGPNGTEWCIAHPWIEPRDEGPTDPPGMTDEKPDGKGSWDNVPLWNPNKVTV